MTIPAFLEKSFEQLDRYGYEGVAGTGVASDTPEFLLPVAKEFDRKGFQVKKKGGGGAYIAPAVHFDGVATMQIAAISTVTNSATFISSHWQKVALNNWSANPPSYSDVPAIYVTDPLGNYAPDFSFTITEPALQPQIDFSAQNDVSGDYFQINSNASPVAGVGSWQHFLCAVKTDFAAGQKLGKIYLNDADITNVLADNFPSFLNDMNGFLFCVGSDAGFDTPLLGDVCDLRLVLSYDPFVGGDLPVAFRRLFIDAMGKPVDPAVATAALGGPGIVLCSGDASVSGFQLNQGTGGAFTLTGTLTNATTSPSD